MDTETSRLIAEYMARGGKVIKYAMVAADDLETLFVRMERITKRSDLPKPLSHYAVDSYFAATEAFRVQFTAPVGGEQWDNRHG
jgi:hypothetical protein